MKIREKGLKEIFLDNRTKKELRDMAKKLGLKTHKVSREKLITNLLKFSYKSLVLGYRATRGS